MLRLARYALLAAFAAFAAMQSASAQQEPVTAFAAASLQDALTAIARKFTEETGIPARFSFASSAVLAKQIEQGAPADVFASADLDWMDWAQERKLIKPQTRIDLLGNKLVVVAPSDAKFSTIFQGLGRNAEHQRRTPDLDHQKRLIMVVLAHIDGAKRQRNCPGRRRIDLRRRLQVPGFAAERQQNADHVLNVFGPQADIHWALFAAHDVQTDGIPVRRHVALHMNDKRRSTGHLFLVRGH
jgi:hypothetical protein